MKKLNYYQVHKNKKNKKPKKLENKKPSYFQIQSDLIAMKSFLQHNIIVSQPFKSIPEKALAVAQNAINQAIEIKNLRNKINSTKYMRS
jgi:hypothetical protein